jgi:DNA-binding transcriptional LysR family regulator
MEMREFRCFVTVAEELHFGRAAERLYLGQPTVSEAVRRLEADVGGALFDRSSRRVSLTTLGEKFLPEARAALVQVRRAYDVGRSLARQADEVLTIGYAEDVGHALLLRCLPALRAQFPGTAPIPQQLDTAAQTTGLERGTLDMGIGWGPVRSTGVTVRRLSTERFVALLPVDHPLAVRRRLRPEDLSGAGVLTWPHQVNSGLCDRLFTAFEQAGATLRIVRTADSVDAIGTHVAAGAGIGMVVGSALSDRPLPGLRAVPLTGPVTTVERVLLLPKRTQGPAQLHLAELLLGDAATDATRLAGAATG